MTPGAEPHVRTVRRIAGRVLVGALGAVLALAACSSGSTTTSSTVGAPTTAEVTPSSTAAAATTALPASTATSPPQPIGADPTSTITAPPSPTGVPGIDVADAFCAAWARYGATVQIIAVAVNYGGLSSADSAVLELESSPTITGAASEIEQRWPAELASEKATALDKYIGPFARRAAKAGDALIGAEASTADVDTIDATWQAMLAGHDPDVPTVDIQLPADVMAKVDAGATAFDAAVNPWGADPSLTADLNAIPLTKQYLAQHCPDLASIGLGDDV